MLLEVGIKFHKQTFTVLFPALRFLRLFALLIESEFFFQKSHDGMSNNRTGHTFIVPGRLRDDGQIFAMHISALKIPAHWYHAVASLRFTERSCITAAKLSQSANPHSFLSITYRVCN